MPDNVTTTTTTTAAQAASSSKKWILYAVIAAAAIAIGAYLIYWIIQIANPGSTAVNDCENNAATVLANYQAQYSQFQTDNQGAPLTQQQLSVINNLYQQYQSAQGQCLATAAQVQAVDDLTSPWVIVAIGVGIGAAIIGLYTGSAIKSRFGKTGNPAANDTQRIRDTTTEQKVEDGELSDDQGEAYVSQSNDIADTEVSADQNTYPAWLQTLEDEYPAEVAELDTVEDGVEAEVDAQDEIWAIAESYFGERPK